ncbi:MAG TPA: putative ABC exporter domain-containing protein, partial [Myxococcaceae bacterium]|nr:putative ABC exporter domain-containing protein [Myxococcaceae bacterium]
MRATVLLWRASFENRVFRQLRRLKQPRYLIATLIGLVYFWSVLLRWLRPRGDGYGLDPRVVPVAEAGLIMLALVVILSAWLFGSNRAQLEFSEAEIQFLFPAPVSRTALLWFKVLKSLLRVLLSALLSAFFVGGVLNSSRGIFFVGAWLGMSTLALHATGASLTRESLTRHGRFGLLRRPVTILVAALMLAGLVLGTLKLSPPLPATTEGPPMDALVSWLSALTNQAPL